MDRLCRPWKNALIIKLLGRSHTYNYLHDRLHQKWSLKGEWKLIDLVNDYFVVKFELEEDLNFVLTGGPWIIASQYLVMQKWRHGFCPATAHITRMVVCLRVSAIQLECFDVWSLKRVGNLLGKLLKIDSLTTAQNKGKFAWMCVELDLTKPLDAFVQINHNWYNIEYEGLPDICYLCGRYDRKREKCEVNVKDVETVNGETTIAMGANVEGSSSVGINRAHYESDQSLRGPWMNVLPRRRPQSNFKGVGGKDSGVKNKGLRFDALRQVGENFGKDEGNIDEFFYQTGNRRMQPFLTDLNMGNKVWTKSKSKKSVARQALEDISNKSLHVKNRVKENRRVGFQGKKSVAAGSLPEQFASWGSGQPVQKEKGLYIFGHQPPNIGEMATSRDDNSGYDSDDEVLIPSDSKRLDPIEKMDFSEGHVSSHVDTWQVIPSSLVKPRISGAKAISVVKSLDFPCFEIVDAVRFSGGLWLLWDDSGVHVEVVGTSDQTISVCVACNGQDPWLFTGVYASPNAVKRAKMWDYPLLLQIVEHRDLTLPKLFPVIDSADLELLEKEIDMAEIKRSLFGIGGLKAPGVDGFPACFYQAQWNKCADDIFAMVTQAFKKCNIPDKLNYTLITLVPKVQSPQSMVQFRPISLC
ncbi:uncharacterized protein LOC18774519 [Prunus persica]|uniref:uncharacterized protein LOC18774519 n=1 Tax=Prunus persica TaxID=3760 RepID=UPI0009AB8F06|nr:uncharacterized protein LOC18774519 [Prunus persica]